jgi:outer membrane protein, multidrug efflux system
VLRALREVEDALLNEREAREEFALMSAAHDSAVELESLMLERYQQGVAPILELLEAQGQRQQARLRMLLAQQAVWNARIDLHLAIGGDWSIELPEPHEAVTGLHHPSGVPPQSTARVNRTE